MTKAYERSARDFITAYQNAWNEGNFDQLMELYAEDGVLVGFITAEGKQAIESLLRGIRDEGWKRVEIRIKNVREINGLILMANEYSAFGSEQIEGKVLNAKSSHVLAPVNGSYLAVLHTAT